MTEELAEGQEATGEVFVDLTDAEAAAVGVEPAKEEADTAPNLREDDDDGDGEGELTAKQARRRRDRQRAKREREELIARTQAAEEQIRKQAEAIAHLMGARVQNEVANADAAFKAAERALLEAASSADPQAIASATVALTQAVNYRDQVRNQAAGLARPQAQTQPQAQPRRIPAAVREWQDRHADWYTPDDPNEETEIALAIDRRLAAEDIYDVGSAEYMAELDRRIAKRLPHVVKQQGQRAKAPPVSSGTSVSTKRIALDPVLVANMREFGLDPTNKEHVKRVLANTKEAA